MNVKLFFKISVLIFGLVMVVAASKYFSSFKFQSSLDQVFNPPVGHSFQWCNGQAQHFEWLDAGLKKKYLGVDAQKVARKFCLVQMGSVSGVDLNQVQWKKLAQGQDSGGQVVYLEGNLQLQLFRAAGLPFKSALLDQELSY